MVDPHRVRQRLLVGEARQPKRHHKRIKIFCSDQRKVPEQHGAVLRSLPHQLGGMLPRPVHRLVERGVGRQAAHDHRKHRRTVVLLSVNGADVDFEGFVLHGNSRGYTHRVLSCTAVHNDGNVLM